jgi:antitoxin Phd
MTMLSVPAVKAQTRFGELIDQAQGEPDGIEVTRYGRPIAYVVSARVFRELQGGVARRKKSVAWIDAHNARVLASRAAGVVNPETEEEIMSIVNDLRN